MRTLVLLVCGCAAILSTSVALGYCLTTTCTDKATRSAQCIAESNVVNGCEMAGQPVYWPTTCLSFSVHFAGSPKLGITADQLEEVVQWSYDNWQSVECPGGGSPSFYVETYPQVGCAEERFNIEGANQNLWVFHDEEWPYESEDDRHTVIAVATLKFNQITGEIVDADVELNSASFEFALNGNETAKDLPSIVQHESGHVLGLADLSIESSATMFGKYQSEWRMRSLEPDDIAGICEVFPPDDTADIYCISQPRDGFTTQCTKPDEGCSIVRGGSFAPMQSFPWFITGFGLVLARWRKRRTVCVA